MVRDLSREGRNVIGRQRYYQLELDDVSTPTFVRFGKYYFGTMEEIYTFVGELEKDEQFRDAQADWEAFQRESKPIFDEFCNDILVMADGGYGEIFGENCTENGTTD